MSRSRHACRLVGLLLLGALSVPATAQSKVWVVDSANQAGANFTDIQPAVTAASDGDVILVRNRGALYGAFTVNAKSLFLVGEPDPSTPGAAGNLPASGPIWVRNVGAGQRVVLRDLVAHSFGAETQPALQVSSSFGPVVLENCFFVRDGNHPDPQPAGLPSGAFVGSSSQVIFTKSTASGENGYLGTVAGSAMTAVDSDLFLHNTQLRGGEGAAANSLGPPAPFVGTTPGGDGLLLAGGSMFAAGGFIWGGNGGSGVVDPGGACVDSSDGGTGLRLVAGIVGGPDVTVMDVDVSRGFAGALPDPACTPASDGLDEDVQAGNLGTIVEDARSFVARSATLQPLLAPGRAAVRETESLELFFQGQVGDFILVFLGDLAPAVLTPALVGPLHLTNVQRTFTFGVLTSDTKAVQIPIAELGPGVEAVPLFMQAAYFSPSSLQLVAADPTLVMLLDRGF